MSISAAALAAMAAGPGTAGVIIDWDPAYFYEAGATPTNSSPGGQLYIVGIVSIFGPPLDFLDASDPTKDYTFYLHGMTSTGTVITPIPTIGNYYTTNYTGGFIEVYEGTPRDAVFDPNPPNANVPSTFINGTLILSGTLNSFYWQSNDFTALNTGNAEGTISWTGGLYFNLMSEGGDPCPGLFTGGTTWLPSLLFPGYIFRHDGKVDLECPTPVQSTSWGRVKSLYR